MLKKKCFVFKTGLNFETFFFFFRSPVRIVYFNTMKSLKTYETIKDQSCLSNSFYNVIIITLLHTLID